MDVGLKIPHLTLSIEAPHHRILVSLGSSGVHLCRHIELLKHVDLPYSKDGSFIPTRIQNTYILTYTYIYIYVRRPIHMFACVYLLYMYMCICVCVCEDTSL